MGRDGSLDLATVFEVTYADDPRFVYRWSYLAVRFLFERHRDEIDLLLNHFRAGDYDAYLAYLDRTIATAHEREWKSWLTEVAVTDAETPSLVKLPRALTVEEEASASYEVALATRPSGDVTVEVRAPENLTVDGPVLLFSDGKLGPGADSGRHGRRGRQHNRRCTRAHTPRPWRGLRYGAGTGDRHRPGQRAGGVVRRRQVVGPRRWQRQTDVSVSETLNRPATIGYVIGADDDAATSDADSADHDGANGSVTIAADASEATFEIAIHDDSNIDPARETFVVSIEPSVFTEFKPGIARTTVVIEEGVCDRSPAIRDALRDSRDCAEVTDADLADVYYLDLGGRLDGELRAGDLSGLTGVVDIRLDDNRLAKLPLGLFSGLASLRVLHLSDNELARLPNDIFDGLALLEHLILTGNELSALPAGIFAGLSGLKRLDLLDNPGTPFTLTPQWLRTEPVDAAAPDSATVVATVVEGAPFAMELGISADNGRLSSDRVRIPVGAARSAPVSVGTTRRGCDPGRVRGRARRSRPPVRNPCRRRRLPVLRGNRNRPGRSAGAVRESPAAGAGAPRYVAPVP